jgi:hypothetical protein
MSLSSGGGVDPDGAEGDNRSSARTRPASPTPTARERNAETSASTPIRISFGDTELTGRLLDNTRGRDLAAQLPLTLTFHDHNAATVLPEEFDAKARRLRRSEKPEQSSGELRA